MSNVTGGEELSSNWVHGQLLSDLWRSAGWNGSATDCPARVKRETYAELKNALPSLHYKLAKDSPTGYNDWFVKRAELANYAKGGWE